MYTLSPIRLFSTQNVLLRQKFCCRVVVRGPLPGTVPADMLLHHRQHHRQPLVLYHTSSFTYWLTPRCAFISGFLLVKSATATSGQVYHHFPGDVAVDLETVNAQLKLSPSNAGNLHFMLRKQSSANTHQCSFFCQI